jgi:hypothetical protein
VPAARLRIVSESDFYLACELLEGEGTRRAAIVDRLGGVVFADEVRSIVTGTGEDFVAALGAAVDGASLNLGLGSLLPRVTVASGRHLVDLSDARSRDDLLGSVPASAGDGPAVAVVAR